MCVCHCFKDYRPKKILGAARRRLTALRSMVSVIHHQNLVVSTGMEGYWLMRDVYAFKQVISCSCRVEKKCALDVVNMATTHIQSVIRQKRVSSSLGPFDLDSTVYVIVVY